MADASRRARYFRFVFNANNHQLYIEDEEAKVTAHGVAAAWTEQTVADGLAPGRSFVRFRAARHERAPVEVRVEDGEPPVDVGAYDRVAGPADCSSPTPPTGLGVRASK